MRTAQSSFFFALAFLVPTQMDAATIRVSGSKIQPAIPVDATFHFRTEPMSSNAVATEIIGQTMFGAGGHFTLPEITLPKNATILGGAVSWDIRGTLFPDDIETKSEPVQAICPGDIPCPWTPESFGWVSHYLSFTGSIGDVFILWPLASEGGEVGTMDLDAAEAQSFLNTPIDVSAGGAYLVNSADWHPSAFNSDSWLTFKGDYRFQLNASVVIEYETPIPEPSTFSFAAVGVLACLAGVRMRLSSRPS